MELLKTFWALVKLGSMEIFSWFRRKSPTPPSPAPTPAPAPPVPAAAVAPSPAPTPTASAPKPTEEKVSTYFGVKLFFGSMLLVLAGTVLLGLFAPTVVLFGEGADEFKISLWLVWAVTGLLYILFSFRFFDPVQPEEIGVRVVFGYPTDVVGPGPAFVPMGIFRLEILTGQDIQREFPAEPNRIYRGDDNAPEGFAPPIRATFRSAVTEAEARSLIHPDEFDVQATDGDGTVRTHTFKWQVPDDGLTERVTAEVVPIVRFQIKDGVAFIRRIGSIDAASQQIEDEMVSVLQRLMPLMSVSQAQQNLPWISTILYNSVVRRTQGWGVEIKPRGAYLKAILTHHTLNEAIAQPGIARLNARAAIETSVGEKTKRVNEGAGTATAAQALEKAKIDGRAEGLANLATALKVSGQEALAAEIGVQVAEGGNTIISDAPGIASLGAAFGAGLNKTKPKPVPATSTPGGTSP